MATFPCLFLQSDSESPVIVEFDVSMGFFFVLFEWKIAEIPKVRLDSLKNKIAQFEVGRSVPEPHSRHINF